MMASRKPQQQIDDSVKAVELFLEVLRKRMIAAVREGGSFTVVESRGAKRAYDRAGVCHYAYNGRFQIEIEVSVPSEDHTARLAGMAIAGESMGWPPGTPDIEYVRAVAKAYEEAGLTSGIF